MAASMEDLRDANRDRALADDKADALQIHPTQEVYAHVLSEVQCAFPRGIANDLSCDIEPLMNRFLSVLQQVQSRNQPDLHS